MVWLAASLACVGTPAAMQITDAPVFTCPTPVPIVPTPYPTFPAIPGYPTLVPLPTPLPPPTVTPYVIHPPDDFYVGDAIYAGDATTPLRARFRLLAVQMTAAPPRTLVTWTLEVINVGSVEYDVFPAAQMFIATITTASGESEGVWGVSSAAFRAAGISTGDEAVALIPGDQQTFTLAAFIPEGAAPRRFTYLLDPTTRVPGTPYPGSNPLTWVNESNPKC